MNINSLKKKFLQDGRARIITIRGLILEVEYDPEQSIVKKSDFYIPGIGFNDVVNTVERSAESVENAWEIIKDNFNFLLKESWNFCEAG